MSTPPPRRPRPFLLACPDLSSERAGNTDTRVWHFDSGVPGKRVMLSALIHGNERAAWALKDALAAGLRPRRGSLTLAFCNLAAFDRFDPSNYAPARFVDEDMNRVWSEDKLSAPNSQERRARPDPSWVERSDWLLDFHSMSNSDVPLQLTGMEQRNIDLALALGNPATIIADAAMPPACACATMVASASRRQRHPLAADRMRFPWRAEAHGVALDQLARFLLAADTVDRADLPAAWFAPDAGAQRALRVTHAVAAKSADFRFAQPWKGWRRCARRRPDRLVRGRAGGHALR